MPTGPTTFNISSRPGCAADRQARGSVNVPLSDGLERQQQVKDPENDESQLVAGAAGKCCRGRT